jgi:hypothetical protein
VSELAVVAVVVDGKIDPAPPVLVLTGLLTAVPWLLALLIYMLLLLGLY